jgi:hypothetical protein
MPGQQWKLLPGHPTDRDPGTGPANAVARIEQLADDVPSQE